MLCSGGGGGGGGGSSAEANDAKVKDQATKMSERMPSPYDLRKVQYSTLQCTTVQYSTVQYSTLTPPTAL